MKQILKSLLFIFCAINASNVFATGYRNFNYPVPARSTSIQMLSTFLFTSSGNMADGNRVVFAAQYSNSVDGNDAIKLNNPGENFGLLRDHRILAIEARQPVSIADTLFYNMNNLVPQNYKLELDPENIIANGITCELVDRYLNTRTRISLTDSNHLILSITADPASKAANRLIVVFKSAVTVLPFTFSGISGMNQSNRSVSINWQVANQQNIVQYEIERSSDNINFSSIATRPSLVDNLQNNNYNFEDMQPLRGENFYRIRSVDKYGLSVFSDHIKIPVLLNEGISVYPNPLVNYSFQLGLNKLMPGKYFIKISSSMGQQIYEKSIMVIGDYFNQTITLDSRPGKGNYTVSIFSGNGIVGTQKIIIP